MRCRPALRVAPATMVTRRLQSAPEPGRTPEPRPVGPLGLAWTVSPVLLAVTALGRAAQNAGQTTYPLMARSLLHLANSTIGGLGASGAVAGVLCSTLIVGRVRRVTPTMMLAAGQALGVLAFVLLATSSGRAGLWSAAVALGAFGGITLPSLMTIIGSGPPSRRARALATFALALSVSLLLGPLVEAAVLHALGGSLHLTFAVLLPVPAAATALAFSAAARERRTSTRQVPAREVPATVQGPAAGEHPALPEGPAPGGDAPSGLRRVSSPLRLAITIMVTYQVPFAAVVSFGGLLARHGDGASPSAVELAFGAFFAVSLVVRAALASRSRSRHPVRLLLVSVAATVTGVALVGATQHFALLLVGMAVLGLPHGSTLPLASAIVAEQTPGDRLARANGLLLASTGAATVVVPFACGWLAQSFGYTTMFLLLEIPVVVLATLLVTQLRSDRATAPDTVAAPPESDHLVAASAASRW